VCVYARTQEQAQAREANHKRMLEDARSAAKQDSITHARQPPAGARDTDVTSGPFAPTEAAPRPTGRVQVPPEADDQRALIQAFIPEVDFFSAEKGFGQKISVEQVELGAGGGGGGNLREDGPIEWESHSHSVRDPPGGAIGPSSRRPAARTGALLLDPTEISESDVSFHSHKSGLADSRRVHVTLEEEDTSQRGAHAAAVPFLVLQSPDPPMHTPGFFYFSFTLFYLCSPDPPMHAAGRKTAGFL
jgi:hypothetical protein